MQGCLLYTKPTHLCCCHSKTTFRETSKISFQQLSGHRGPAESTHKIKHRNDQDKKDETEREALPCSRTGDNVAEMLALPKFLSVFNENVLEFMVTVVHLCEHTEKDRTVHFKRMNFVAYELRFNKCNVLAKKTKRFLKRVL